MVVLSANELCPQTTSVDYLRVGVIRSIHSRLAINQQDNEYLQILHSHGGNYNKMPVEFVGACFIGLTNKRVFKIENDLEVSIYFKDMISCEHETRKLHWDNLCIKTNDQRMLKLGIFRGKTAAYFNKHITYILEENWEKLHDDLGDKYSVASISDYYIHN